MKEGLKNSLLSICPLILLCGLSFLLQTQALQKIRLKSESSPISYATSDISLFSLKNAPSFGLKNLIADWSFIQFLQYFGDDDAREHTGYGDSAKYLSVAIHHDPFFRDFYIFLSGSSTLYAGKPEQTVKVMSEGLAQLILQRAPDSYYVWRYKGTDELLFLNDGKSAQKSFEMAAKWAAQSDNADDQVMSQLSKQTAQFLADNPDSKLAQINAWGSVLTTALDNETRKRVIMRIQELGGDVVIGSDGQLQIKYAQVEKTPGGGKPDS